MKEKQSKSREIRKTGKLKAFLALSLFLLTGFCSFVWAQGQGQGRAQARKPGIILVPGPLESGFKGLAEFERNLLNAFQKQLPGQEIKVIPQENKAYNAYLEISESFGESFEEESAEQSAAKGSVKFDQAALKPEDSQDASPVQAVSSRLDAKISFSKDFAKKTQRWSPKDWARLHDHLVRFSRGENINIEVAHGVNPKAGLYRIRWADQEKRIIFSSNRERTEIALLVYASKADWSPDARQNKVEQERYNALADQVASGAVRLASEEESDVLVSKLKKKEQASSGTDSGLSPPDSEIGQGHREIPPVESVLQSHGNWKVNDRIAEVLEDRGFKTVLTHPYGPAQVVKVSYSELGVVKEEVLKNGVLEMIGEAPEILEWGWKGYGFIVQNRVSGPRVSEIVPGRWKPEEMQALKDMFRTLIRHGIYMGEAFQAGRDVILGVVSGSDQVKAYVVSSMGLSMRVSELRSGRSGKELMRYYEGILRKWTGDKKTSLRK